MSSEEDRNVVKIVLGFYVPIMVAWGILYLCGYHITYMGDPVLLWIVMSLCALYSFFSWKDKRGFFKRCVLALPFALLAVVLLRLTVFGLPDSFGWWGGTLMFILLTRDTKNLKRGFVISLVTSIILIVLIAIMVILAKNVLAP